LLLLLPVDRFSPPWLERLLLLPFEALAWLDERESSDDDLRGDDDRDESEDLLPDFMSCSLEGWTA
jgi:hypothetical protein